MLTLTVIQGNKSIGCIPSNEFSQEWLRSRVEKEIVFYPVEKQSPYLRNKYWQFLECCMGLPEYVLYDILKGKEFDSIEKQKDYFRKKILVACGYTEPTLVPEGDDLVWRDLPKRTSKMGDEEFMKMYADMREAVFAICFKPRIRLVNGAEQIVRMSDFDLFETFKALYLGFEMKHIAEVETQLGLMDVAFHNNYLKLCKMTGAPLTVEQFNIMSASTI
jgi:hypothetical protein